MSSSQARPQQPGAQPGAGRHRTEGGERSAAGRAAGDDQAQRNATTSRPASAPGSSGDADGDTSAQARRAAAAGGAQRRVRLSVSRVDPWSALKLSFLLSVVVGIALVVAAGTLWTVLDAVGVYDSVNSLIAQLSGTGDIDVTDYVGFSQVVSAATVLAVVDVVIITALATLGSVVYNVSAALVGGLRVTLTDD